MSFDLLFAECNAEGLEETKDGLSELFCVSFIVIILIDVDGILEDRLSAYVIVFKAIE